jgi:hypothetical protein
MNGDILANRSAKDRNATDFYPTPPDVTVALLDFLEKKGVIKRGQSILEPACGTGEMVRAMEARGYDVYYSDIKPAGPMADTLPRDFLKQVSTHCTWIITNPPFSSAEAFIRHAMDMGRPCAFLLKSQFWHAKRRLPLFRRYTPSYILPLTWRPDFLNGSKSGSPTMEVAWSVWVPWVLPTAQYIPLERPQEVQPCD